MPSNKISTRLQSEISVVLAGTEVGIFIPKCILHNPNTGFKLIPRYTKAIDITQDFAESYMDATQVVIQITPKEYMDILDNVQDLECTIILSAVNPNTNKEILSQTPIFIKGSVIAKNQDNLSKMFSGQTVPVNDETRDNGNTFSKNEAVADYTFHLIDKKSFDIRHTQISSILSNVNMEQVLHWVAQQMGIGKIKIVPPDNKQVYANFIIPPSNISNIFNFFQERYGIYSKGLGYYYSDDTLYMYPQFDTDRDNSTERGIVRIISIPENEYLGMDHYHVKKEDDIWVMSNTNKIMKSLNAVGEENSGNVHISANTDNQRDHSVEIGKDGKVTRKSNVLSVVQMSNKSGSMNSKSQNIKFVGQRSNIYQSTSEMAANDGSILGCGWNHAMPKSIKPGQVITYQYDDTGAIFTTQKGRILTAEYKSQIYPSDKKGVFWIGFNCSLTMFLDPEKKADDIVAYN